MAIFIYEQNVSTLRAKFETRSDGLAATITRELEFTVGTIEAAASALRLSDDMSDDGLRERLYDFLRKGDLLSHSPSIRNVGLVMNRGFGQPEGASDEHTLIGVYPQTDSRVIGADLSFSPERMAAIQYAKERSTPGVGDRIVLLSGLPGVFFAYPIYATADVPETVEDRRAQTVGLVVAVMSTQSFMANALRAINIEGVDFEVHDLGDERRAFFSIGAETVLASSRLGEIDYANLVGEELLANVAPETIQRDIGIGGHTWRILVAPKPVDGLPFAFGVALGIATVGFALAALAGLATYQQLSHAVDLTGRVEERTQALQSANMRISKQANEDELTGLGNRRALSRALKDMIDENAGSREKMIATVHIDLDRFKQINDTMGHAGGDFILRHVAKLIVDAFPQGAFCARVGGDEFTAATIVDDLRMSALTKSARDLVASCAEPVAFEGRPCRFGASVGIAVQPIASADPNALLVNADLALYRAKEDGRGRVQLFSPEIHAQVIAHKNRSDDILRAIEAGNEFVPYFQPQIRSSDGSLYGVEALARWEHPELGVLPPSEFLPIAEDLDVVAQIDRCVLERAIEVVNRANTSGRTVAHLSTNLSFARLMEDDFIASISDLPKCESSISFEILESIFLDDETGPAMWNIDSLRSAGMEVQIDDFGSGRASVVALTRIAPSRMKIDRELVAPIVEFEERLSLVKSIVEIGKVLDIGVTAEGVETPEQAQLLIDMGCDVLQGYLFAKPLSEPDLFAFISSEVGIAVSSGIRWKPSSVDEAMSA